MSKTHIHIRRRALHRTRVQLIHIPRHIGVLLAVLTIVAPTWAAMEGSGPKPYEQDFIITAYYSPLPDQCCYVKGSEVADKILNGQGVAGADGTPVYPGMIAAPPTYAFGTRVVLPGIGIVTVHDRGGAIQEVDKGHRLDLWAGYGEEGLARALAFGVQRVRGTIYPVGSNAPAERLILENIQSPAERLKPFLTLDNGLLDARPKLGQRGLSVVMLQEHLRDAGYFTHAVTDLYGEATQQALAQFLKDMGVHEPSDQLTEHAVALLIAAVKQRRDASPVALVGPESSAADIASAQRLLRFFGVYRGRTNGQYDETTKAAIIVFQKNHLLIGDATSPGAGRIGPLTRKQLIGQWERTMIVQRAERFLLFKRISKVLAERGSLPERFLESGYTGDAVRQYQLLLADRGFFPHDKINGVFGELTREATVKYQVAAGLIRNGNDEGAGTVGPKTMRKLRTDAQQAMYKLVRSYGLQVL